MIWAKTLWTLCECQNLALMSGCKAKDATHHLDQEILEGVDEKRIESPLCQCRGMYGE